MRFFSHMRRRAAALPFFTDDPLGTRTCKILGRGLTGSGEVGNDALALGV